MNRRKLILLVVVLALLTLNYTLVLTGLAHKTYVGDKISQLRPIVPTANVHYHINHQAYSLNIPSRFTTSSGQTYEISYSIKEYADTNNGYENILQDVLFDITNLSDSSSYRFILGVSEPLSEYSELGLETLITKKAEAINTSNLSAHRFHSEFDKVDLWDYEFIRESNYRNDVLEFEAYHIKQSRYIVSLFCLPANVGQGNIMNHEELVELFAGLEINI